MDKALGEEGAKICRVHEVYRTGDNPDVDQQPILIKVSNCVETSGEPAGSDMQAAFSNGAVWGAIEAVWGKQYTAEQTESTLKGAEYDTFVLTPM